LDKLVQERIKQFPDELAYVRSASMLPPIVGSLASLGIITKGIIDKGQSTANDLNLYAWYALPLPAPIARTRSRPPNVPTELTRTTLSSLTLACLYADAKGRPSTGTPAQAMDVQH